MVAGFRALWMTGRGRVRARASRLSVKTPKEHAVRHPLKRSEVHTHTRSCSQKWCGEKMYGDFPSIHPSSCTIRGEGAMLKEWVASWKTRRDGWIQGMK